MSELGDLLVVGAGSLGARVATVWQASSPAHVNVLAETRGTERHDALERVGVTTRRRSDPPPALFPFVLFAVPPSALGRADKVAAAYRAEARRAAGLWNGRGMLVLSSSTAVYAESEGGPCTERSPLTETSRAQRLLGAEEEVLLRGGCVVRLAGLYDDQRGPHRVFLRMERSPRRPDGVLNLIHYDDAASLCVGALVAGRSREVYMGCDGAPLTRNEIVRQAFEAGHGKGRPSLNFEGRDGPLGRRCDNGWTRDKLMWTPRYASFGEWLKSEAL
ncbi:MAG: hypothetical protein HN348_02680 [Proteobacteria bacterium]|nr:hypothetical protein [Pseudomonadota bacterium]